MDDDGPGIDDYDINGYEDEWVFLRHWSNAGKPMCRSDERVEFSEARPRDLPVEALIHPVVPRQLRKKCSYYGVVPGRES